MKGLRIAAMVAIGVGLTLGLVSPASATGRESFSFNAPVISGFPGGRSAVAHRRRRLYPAGFRSRRRQLRLHSDISAGLFTGCQNGQGVRWDTDTALTSTTFRCTGAATETLKAAETGDKTVVMLADFYREGDGNDDRLRPR